MIELEEITIEKKELLNKYLKEANISELTFTNLFLWKKPYDSKYYISNDTLCIIDNHEKDIRYLSFPKWNSTQIEMIINDMEQHFDKIGKRIIINLYNEESKRDLSNLFPNKFIITENVDHFDYIYLVKDLIDLSGDKYHKKKNHVNRFKLLYNYEYRKINKENLLDCKLVFDKWYHSKLTSDIYTEEAKEAIYELFNNFDNLDIVGGGIYVDNKMVAFSFGEKLNHNTAIIYYEYADVDYKGAFQFINQQFLENEWSNYTYVNRECDLGIPGLRKAKQSYYPVCMINKYIAK